MNILTKGCLSENQKLGLEIEVEASFFAAGENGS